MLNFFEKLHEMIWRPRITFCKYKKDEYIAIEIISEIEKSFFTIDLNSSEDEDSIIDLKQ